MKQVLAVDIDDVIFPFVPELAKFHNQRFDTELDIDSFHSYIFNEVWGGTSEEGHSKVMDFFETDCMEVEPIAGSRETLARLSSQFDLFIVTSRDEELRSVTEPWIEKYFKDFFQELILCGNPYTGNGYISKVQTCKKIGAQFLIDDQRKYCQECGNEGVRSIIFGDYRWNRGTVPTLSVRARDWGEVERIIGGS